MADLTLSGTSFAAAGDAAFGQELTAGYGFTDYGYMPGTEFTCALRIFLPSTAGPNFFGAAVGVGDLFWIGTSEAGETVINIGAFPGDLRLYGPTFINDDAYHHIVVVSNSSGVVVYLDGAVEISTATTIASLGGHTSERLDVAGLLNIPGWEWEGYVDEVALFTTEPYTGPFTPPTEPYANSTPGLHSLWHLDGDGIDSAGLPDVDPPDPPLEGVALNGALSLNINIGL